MIYRLLDAKYFSILTHKQNGTQYILSVNSKRVMLYAFPQTDHLLSRPLFKWPFSPLFNSFSKPLVTMIRVLMLF